MKRTSRSTLIVATLLTALLLAGTASANWGRGGDGFDCPQGRMAAPQMDQETQAKVSQFHQENEILLREMVMKRAEKRALMAHDQPDPQAAAKLAGELFDLRSALQAKAVEAGVEQYMGAGRMGMGPDRMGRGGMGCSGPMGGGRMNQAR